MNRKTTIRLNERQLAKVLYESVCMALENETAAVRRLKCTMWGRDCIFYTTDENNNDGIALLNEDGWKNMHFVFKSKPSGETLDKLYRAISSDLKSGDTVSSNGGISPGGLNGLRNLAKYGSK